MKQYIDLHMHTVNSDGVKTTSELLDIVRESKVSVFSITDHDTIAAYEEIAPLLTDDDPRLINGVELSVTVDDADMHLLAYMFDLKNDRFNNALEKFCESRNRRGQKMVEKLNELGVPLDYEAVKKEAHSKVIGRPHLAQALFNNGFVNSYEEAFFKYIGDHAPACVMKDNFTPKEAIEIVHQAGGIMVLAHPGIHKKEQHLEMLIELGLDGIEAYHPAHKQPQVDYYLHLADRFRLVATGGSDYHGREGRFSKIGAQRVPFRFIEKLEQKVEERRG